MNPINKKTSEKQTVDEINDYYFREKEMEKRFDQTKLTPPPRESNPILIALERIEKVIRQALNRLDRVEKVVMDYLDDATKGRG